MGGTGGDTRAPRIPAGTAAFQEPGDPKGPARLGGPGVQGWAPRGWGWPRPRWPGFLQQAGRAGPTASPRLMFPHQQGQEY